MLLTSSRLKKWVCQYTDYLCKVRKNISEPNYLSQTPGLPNREDHVSRLGTISNLRSDHV